MIINRMILKVKGSEYELLRFNYKFQRDTDLKGRPCSGCYGGEIIIQLESTDSIRLFQQMIDKDRPMVEGSIEALADDDETCVRRIVFKEACFYFYEEQMQSTGCLPMTTTISISPMRLDFNNNQLRLDRKWPRAPYGWQRYETQEVKYARGTSSEEKENMKIMDAYWIDEKNKKQRNLLTDYPVKLYVVLKEYTVGAEAKFHFVDEDNEGWGTADFSGIIERNGMVEINDFQLKIK